MPRLAAALLSALAVLGSAAPSASAADYYVATDGDDARDGLTPSTAWRTIQKAASTVPPGSTVNVRAGVYHEKVVVGVSGLPGQPVTFQPYAGEGVVLDGTGVAGAHLVEIVGRSWVRWVGFEMRNLLAASDGSAVRIEGAGTGVEVRGNRIHELRGTSAMGITVYGTDGTTPISGLVVEGNEVFDAEPAPSEAIVVNGNVDGFRIAGNVVHDVNNIGVDVIGGEGTCPVPASDAARNGVVAGNVVFRARSSYGGGFGAGIYVDGGRDVVVERNVVHSCDLGIEVGAENAGTDATRVTVRGNALLANDKAGLVFGGYDASVGRVTQSAFRNNTLYGNDALGLGYGQLWVQWASGNVVSGNVVHGGARTLLLNEGTGSASNGFDHNVWWCDAGAAAAVFEVGAASYTGFAAYRSGTGRDAHGAGADPLLAAPAAGDVHLLPGSPALDAADPSIVPAAGETDLDGEARPVGTALDAGADEGGRAPSRLHTLAPCRLLDTRGAAGPFGGPALPPGSTRLFLLAGRCGVPPSARALSVNLTAVLPAAAGWLGLRPAAATPPAPTSVLNFAPLRVRANNAVVSLSGDGGALAVVSGSPGAVDVVLDVNGWFE